MTIKVTDAMIAAVDSWDGTPSGRQAMIEAILAEIDHIPDDVDTIKDRDGDEWTRVNGLTWALRGHGYDIVTVISRFGPVTW